MNPVIGWTLAAIAVAVGFWQYGWKGVVLAVTVIVFWLLLQFSRALRAMRDAGGRPVGTIDSAVMLNAKLKRGMTLMQVITITRSLGRQVGQDPERWRWVDPGGVSVTLTMAGAKLASWQLERPDDAADSASAPERPE
jgi:hypothetical protein